MTIKIPIQIYRSFCMKFVLIRRDFICLLISVECEQTFYDDCNGVLFEKINAILTIFIAITNRLKLFTQHSRDQFHRMMKKMNHFITSEFKYLEKLT